MRSGIRSAGGRTVPGVALSVMLLGGIFAGEDPAPPRENTWVKLSPLESTPTSPRLGYEGACVWDSAHGVMIRYGGHNQGGGGEQNAEVWSFDPSTARWKLHEPNTSPPGVCCAQQNVFDPVQGRYVRFPAFSASHGWQWRREVWLNDSSIWTYDLATNTWSNLRPLPAPRIRPLRCASWDAEHEVIVVFGGEGSHDGTLVYDPWTNIWTRMHPSVEPDARSAGNMAYDAGCGIHVLFGSQFTDDPHTWTYDLGKNEWRDRKPERMPPTDRNDAVLAYDPLQEVVLALVKRTEGEDEQAKHRLETWAYDTGENTWTKRNPEIEPDPSGNRARGLLFAPGAGGILLENCTHPPQGRREQQIWVYRHTTTPRLGSPPPLPPERITLTTSQAGIELAWGPSSSADVERYELLRGSGETPWSVELRPLATVPASARSYRDTDVETGAIYHYALRSQDAGGNEGPCSARLRSQPRIVEDAVVTVRSEEDIELRWEPPRCSTAVGYRVERARVAVLSDAQLAPLSARTPPRDPPSVGGIVRIGNPVLLTTTSVTETTFIDRDVDLASSPPDDGEPLYERRFSDDDRRDDGAPYPYAVYAYRIRAVNALGVESGPSPPFFTIPSSPQEVFAREDGTTCRLRWRPNAEGGIRGYRVYRMDGRYDSASITRLTDAPITTHEYSGETAGKATRRYSVVAVDALGQEGFPSAPVWFQREWKRFYDPFTGEWHQ